MIGESAEGRFGERLEEAARVCRNVRGVWGGSYFLEGVREKGGSSEPPNPPGYGPEIFTTVHISCNKAITIHFLALQCI